MGAVGFATGCKIRIERLLATYEVRMSAAGRNLSHEARHDIGVNYMNPVSA